jgi:hypothetical protein
MQKLAYAAGGRNSLSWHDVERITRGRLGMTRSTCPFCSESRGTTASRRAKVFAVTLKDPDFAIFNCVHCGESGYVHPDAPAKIIDFAEHHKRRVEAKRREQEDEQNRIGFALRIWDECLPLHGSPAEVYLRDTRGIGDWLDAFDVNETLAFHPECPFDGTRLPCMVALVRDVWTDAKKAIHRTALRLGDRVERISRMTLGPIKAGAIKFDADDAVTMGLMVGEGIESVLSLSKKMEFRPCWSLVSAAGVRAFPVLTGIDSLTIAVDNDMGRTGERAAAECAARWVKAGREVRRRIPRGCKDFNDLLLKEIGR